jgi:hypothetical protein
MSNNVASIFVAPAQAAASGQEGAGGWASGIWS